MGAEFKSNSLSGGERHRIFFRRHGNYKEYSLVSGADFREDGRGFVLFDYDGDGFQDMGITSPNVPRFRIIRNEIGDHTDNRSVQIALVGGNWTSQSSDEWSPRDAFGARVVTHVGTTQRMMHLSLGEGLSGQNSKRIHVGLGDADQIDLVEVIWPSGKRTLKKRISAGTVTTVFENPAQEEIGK